MSIPGEYLALYPKYRLLYMILFSSSDVIIQVLPNTARLAQ
jgi:hypothetical protein